MDRIPVQFVGNNSKRYNGKVWLERLQDIVEVNGRQISEPLCPSSFKGDAVKVRQLVKVGRVKLWKLLVHRRKNDQHLEYDSEARKMIAIHNSKEVKAADDRHKETQG